MELINRTRMRAGYTMALEPDGGELLVVVVKGTFGLPMVDGPLRLHDEQLPLVTADTYTGEPGYSAPMYEVDFSPRKSACDVLLVGSAYAPAGRLVTRMRVALRVGPMEKSFDVVGDRVWRAGATGIRATAPQPFERVPISYDVAFGGADRRSEDPSEHDAYPANPVGRGWHKHLKSEWVDGAPLPNTEAIGEAVSFPSDGCTPMALGPIGRGWPTRARFAGTYDDQWRAEVFPFLPADFDERYYQAAHEDQQIPLPQGPLEVELRGFTPDGMRRFVLPHLEAAIQIAPRGGTTEQVSGSLDTIVLAPDASLVTLTWRHSRKLRRGIHEIDAIMIGRAPGRSFPVPIVPEPPAPPPPA